MNLIDFAGEKTGVPYPVLARASFGIWGANLAAMVRAVVACFWYGAQTAAASGAIVALMVRNEGMLEFHKTMDVLGTSGLEVICYVFIWALQLMIIQRGMETVRKFQDWAGPAVWVIGCAKRWPRADLLLRPRPCASPRASQCARSPDGPFNQAACASASAR